MKKELISSFYFIYCISYLALIKLITRALIAKHPEITQTIFRPETLNCLSKVSILNGVNKLYPNITKPTAMMLIRGLCEYSFFLIIFKDKYAAARKHRRGINHIGSILISPLFCLIL